MSVLVNLLPDIRQQRQKEAERKQLFTGGIIIVLIVCGVVIGLLLLVLSSQMLLINKTRGDIANKKQQLQSTTGLVDAINAQARLDTLQSLEPNKVLVTKLLASLAEVSPTVLQITGLKYDTNGGTLMISGTADTYYSAAKVSRALEAAHVTIGTGSPSEEPYYTNVKLSSVTKSANKTSFSITATVAPGATHGK